MLMQKKGVRPPVSLVDAVQLVANVIHLQAIKYYDRDTQHFS